MKYILIWLILVISNISLGQGNVRIYLEKPNQLYKQTIIAFSDTTTDNVDNCCDAYLFSGNENHISTSIGNQEYAINSFGYLYEDKNIKLNTVVNPDTGLFIIGIDYRFGENIAVGLYDSLNNIIHDLSTPYICYGPILDRFSLVFEKPLNVEVINSCDLGYVIIDNDVPNSAYYLTTPDNQTLYLPNNIDTIFDLPSGNYILSLPLESLIESTSFTINNTVIDASLNIPNTTLYLGDSYIIPILNIYSQYTSVEWDFGDGNFLYNDLNPVHYYSQSGVYNLKVTITEGQCNKIFESIITINSPLGLNNIDYRNIPRYKPTTFYYAIDGRLMKRP